MTAKALKRTTGQILAPNLANSGFGQASRGVRFSSGRPQMNVAMKHVLFGGDPLKVPQRIVRRISVEMSALEVLGQRRASERKKNQSMDACNFAHSVRVKMHSEMPGVQYRRNKLSGLSPTLLVPHERPDSTADRDFISSFVARNRLPDSLLFQGHFLQERLRLNEPCGGR